MRDLHMSTFTRSITLTLFAVSGLALAQDAPRGWRRVGDPPPQVADQAANPDWQNQNPDQNQNPEADRAQAGDAQQNAAPPNYSQPNYQPESGIPPRLVIKPGTYLTVRVNQPLSSDHNQAGDAFSATLLRPVVVDGIVVAQSGQTV